MRGSLQIDHEPHRCKQQVRIERGDVGAVALAGFENAHDAERTNPLAKRTARDAEHHREVFLNGESGAWAERACRDHVFDPLKHNVGLREAAGEEQ